MAVECENNKSRPEPLNNGNRPCRGKPEIESTGEKKRLVGKSIADQSHAGVRDTVKEHGVRTALNIRDKVTQKGMLKLELFRIIYYILHII